MGYEDELMAVERKKPQYELALGPDVDLEREDIRDRRGRRLTQQYVEEAVADVHAGPGSGIGRGRVNTPDSQPPSPAGA